MIDDVEHLLRNSVQDSAVLFVDSGSRNRVAYPTPSEYVIDLEEPIRNVFGMSVLDAAIANTMYNVDWNNNYLRFVTVATSASKLMQAARSAAANAQTTYDAYEAADVDTLNAEFFAMGFASPLCSWLGDVSRSSYSIAVVSDADYASRPPQAPAAGDEPSPGALSYVLVRAVTRGVTLRSTTGSLSPQASKSEGWVSFNGASYDASSCPVLLEYAKSNTPFAILPSRQQASGTYSFTASSTYDVYSFAAKPLFPGQFSSYTSSGSIVQLSFTIAGAVVEVGNYTSLTQLQAALQTAFGDAGSPIGIVSTSSGGLNKNGAFAFSGPADGRFLFSTTYSTMAGVLGFDLNASLSSNAVPRVKREYSAIALGGGNGNASLPLYSSVLTDDVGQQLSAPGIANLLGPRFIVLRCPEIEQHIGTTGKYGRFSTGIGVFKLQSTNQVAQVRFDYVSLVNKPFHPIGRLHRLTLRFEMSDGSLYDFKGINHQLLLSIKYHAPTQGVDHARGGGGGDLLGPDGAFVSSLNPDYDPDFQRYLARQSAYAPRLDDQGFDPFDEDDVEDDVFGYRGETGGGGGGGDDDDAEVRYDRRYDDHDD